MQFHFSFFFRQDNTNQTISDSVPPQSKVKPEGERGTRVNSFKSESRMRSEGSMRMKVEQISNRRAKRERSDWLEDTPIASSSSQESSVWELQHEFYLQANKEMKEGEEEEVEEIKEEEFKPTKKILTRILEEYQQSRSLKRSSASHQLQKFGRTQKDSYECGLCGYKTEVKEKLDKHWEFGCKLSQYEAKQGKPVAYQCSGCAVRIESKSLIERHTKYECQGFIKLPLQMLNLKAY